MGLVGRPLRGVALLALVLAAGGSCRDSVRVEGEGPLDIDPYLTGIGTDWAALNWRTRAARVSRISYGITFDCELGEIELDNRAQHRVELTGLSPGTRYHYEVDNQFRGSFRTVHPSDHLRFAVIGHTHGTENPGHYPDEWLTESVRALQPQFLIHVGDATYHATPGDFGKYFFRPFSAVLSSIPVYLAPGNHDAGWPFIHGKNLSVFKELFPYPYPSGQSEDEDAYYASSRGSTLLLFLSYTSEIGPGSAQRNWIEQQIKESDHTFHALVYGGVGKYFDGPSLLDFAADLGVDWILNGDGDQEPMFRRHRGMPVFFTGSSTDRPHVLLLGEAREYFVEFQALEASGTFRGKWGVHSKRELEPFYELTPFRILKDGRTHKYRFKFEPPIDLSNVGGLQMKISAQVQDGRLSLSYVTPDTAVRGERGYRTQSVSIGSGDTLVTTSLPSIDPFTGEAFAMRELLVQFGPLHEGEDITVESFRLFAPRN